METQTRHPLSLRTRDQARAALARAFEEAAVMPGNLLPYEILTELSEVAAQIVEEVSAQEYDDAFVMEGSGPWAYIVEHSIDATAIGVLIGRRLLPQASLQELGVGLFLQDIGMLALPQSVVQKPGPLAPDEWDLMMQHPLLGLEFLRGDVISTEAKHVVRSHHERWDGSGYPRGLIGEEIPLLARIAAVADAFDAVTSQRYHARAESRDGGLEVIGAGTGSAFDPVVVEAFLEVASL